MSTKTRNSDAIFDVDQRCVNVEVILALSIFIVLLTKLGARLLFFLLKS